MRALRPFLAAFLAVVLAAADLAADEVVPRLVVQTGHASRVQAIAFSPDGNLLASGDWEARVKLWDLDSGREIRTFKAPIWVVDLAFSADGTALNARDRNGASTCWEVASGKEVRVEASLPERASTLALSPDGKLAARPGKEGTVVLEDAATGAAIRTLTGHSHPVARLAFSPDGKTLASGSGRDYFGFEKNSWEVKLWNVESGAPVLHLGQEHEVSALAFSPDGKVIASAGWAVVRLWEAATGRCVLTLGRPSAPADCPAFLAGGKLLGAVSVCRTPRPFLWDLGSGRARVELPKLSHFDEIAFAPDGTTLALSSGQAVRLIEADTGKPVRLLAGSPERGSTLGFSPESLFLAVAGQTEQSAILSVLKGQISIRDFSGPGLKPWHDLSAGVVKIWNVKSGAEVHHLQGHLFPICCLTFSFDGKTLATGGLDETVRLWDLSAGRELHALRGHTAGVLSVAFSPDGRTLASAGWDHTVKLWDPSTGRELRTLTGHSQPVHALAFSPDGTMLASGSNGGSVLLWEAEGWREVHRLSLDDDVRALAFSPDGRHLLAGDGALRLFALDGPAPREVCALHLFEDGSWAAADPEGRYDSSGGGDLPHLHWVVGTAVHPLERFRVVRYRPGLLAEALGKQP